MARQPEWLDEFFAFAVRNRTVAMADLAHLDRTTARTHGRQAANVRRRTHRQRVRQVDDGFHLGQDLDRRVLVGQQPDDPLVAFPRRDAADQVRVGIGHDEQEVARAGAGDSVAKALRIDSNVMLVDDPVKRVDNMTMAWGLEARVPFLDHELAELAARIPSEMKLAGGGKGILKDVARKVIPSEVIDRPKGYFPVPALKYLQGPYLELVRDALGAQAARQRGLFRQDYVDALLADPTAHITPLQGSELWQVALLELWLQEHGIA